MRRIDVAAAIVVGVVFAATAFGKAVVVSPAAANLPIAPANPTPNLPDLSAACETENPYLVTACYKDYPNSRGDTAAILVFNDTDHDEPHFTIASESQVGAVWGLAYSEQNNSIYAAAFHKRQMRFGPAGPGAIYQIDLATGEVATFAVVPDAGADRHEASVERGPDRAARDWAGKTSLGGLDTNDSQTELFVMNLNDRRIYRYAVPSGALLGSFAHGASAEPWADDARPFAVKYHNGRLYHGVVNSAENERTAVNLDGYVYSSDLDGSDMQMVAEFNLGYDRGRFRYDQYDPAGGGAAGEASLDWMPWVTTFRSTRDDGWFWFRPMPLVADIEFERNGNMILGIKDRALDAGLTTRDLDDELRHYLAAPRDMEFPVFGAGDTLRGRKVSGLWKVETEPEFFEDGSVSIDETNLSGLAVLPTPDKVVSAGIGFSRGWNRFPYWVDRGANWLQLDDGQRVGRERLCSAPVIQGICKILVLPTGDMGDIELLCSSSAPTATVSPTATALPSSTPTVITPVTPSVTPEPTATTTSTPTVRPARRPIFLPITLREHCDITLVRADVVLVIDTSSSMAGPKLQDAKEAAIEFVALMDLTPGRDQVAVVRFDTDAELTARFGGDRATVEQGLRELETRQGTHVDLGLQKALRELQSPRAVVDNTPVIVLLTDGMHTGAPGAEIIAAREARDAGVKLYTIGLGDDVEQSTLIEMAGTRSRHFFAPDSSHLKSIYRDVAHDIDCPAEDFWGQR